MFVDILKTPSCGIVLCHAHDTGQSAVLKASGYPMAIQEIKALAPYVKPESVFVDIGANIGSFTLMYARICKKVIAFEAQRMFANMLAGSVAINGLQNVWVHNIALSDRPGSIPMPQFNFAGRLAWGSVEFSEKQLEPIGQTRLPDNVEDRVLVERLDNLLYESEFANYGLPEFNRVDVLKIDVEGMEDRVLKGAEFTIVRFKPVMLIEHLKSDKEALHLWLTQHDYDCKDLGMDFLCIPKEKS